MLDRSPFDTGGKHSADAHWSILLLQQAVALFAANFPDRFESFVSGLGYVRRGGLESSGNDPVGQTRVPAGSMGRASTGDGAHELADDLGYSAHLARLRARQLASTAIRAPDPGEIGERTDGGTD